MLIVRTKEASKVSIYDPDTTDAISHLCSVDPFSLLPLRPHQPTDARMHGVRSVDALSRLLSEDQRTNETWQSIFRSIEVKTNYIIS